MTRPLPVLLALAALLGGCAGELYANEVALGGGEPAQGLGVAVVNVDTDVGQNSPPVITSLKISPEQPSSTVDISMNYAFDDPDGDIPVPQYVWRVNGAQVSVASRLKAHLFDKDDVISAELVLTDAEGATDRAALEVTVQDGSAPVVHRCSIDPLTLDVTTELSAGALATHPDGDAVALRFSWQRRHANGAWEDLPVSQVRTLAPCLDRADADCQPDDEFRVQCEAEDAVHGTSHRISSAVARLVNRGPDLVSLAFDPSPPRPGVAVEALVEAEDLDDGIDTTAYTWTVDGVVVSTEPTLPGDAVTLDATLTLDVVVTDPSGDSDAGSLSVTVGNSPPVVDRCSVTPGPTPVAQDWFAFAEGTDPDGDTLTNRIYWEMWLDLDGPGPGGWSWVTLPGEEGETAPSCADRRAPYGTPEAAYNCFSGGQYRARCEIEDAHGARAVAWTDPAELSAPDPGSPCGMFVRADEPNWVGSALVPASGAGRLETSWQLPVLPGMIEACAEWEYRNRAQPSFGLRASPANAMPSPGVPLRLEMAGLPNGRQARLYMSTQGVARDATCPAALNGACVDLIGAVAMGRGTAQGGSVPFDVTLQGNPGDDVWFKAVAIAHPNAQSNVLHRRLRAECPWDADEPNNEPINPTVVPGGPVVDALYTDRAACDEDADWYQVDAATGDIVTFTVTWDPLEGRPRMRGISDGQAAVVDSDDTSWVWQSRAAADGPVTLRVDAPERDIGLVQGATYDLHVDVQPGTSSLNCFPGGGGGVHVIAGSGVVPGFYFFCGDGLEHEYLLTNVSGWVQTDLTWVDDLELELTHGLDDPFLHATSYTSPGHSTLFLQVPEDGSGIPLFVQRSSREALVSEGGVYDFVITELAEPPVCEDDVFEPNDDLAAPSSLPHAPPVTVTGSVCPSSVYDWFTLPVTTPSELQLTLEADDAPVDVILVSPGARFLRTGHFRGDWSGRLSEVGDWKLGVWLPGHGFDPIEGGTVLPQASGLAPGSDYSLDVALQPISPCPVGPYEPDDDADQGATMLVGTTRFDYVCDDDVDHARFFGSPGVPVELRFQYARDVAPIELTIEGELGQGYSLERAYLGTEERVRVLPWESGSYTVRIAAEDPGLRPASSGWYTLELLPAP